MVVLRVYMFLYVACACEKWSTSGCGQWQRVACCLASSACVSVCLCQRPFVLPPHYPSLLLLALVPLSPLAPRNATPSMAVSISSFITLHYQYMYIRNRHHSLPPSLPPSVGRGLTARQIL